MSILEGIHMCSQKCDSQQPKGVKTLMPINGEWIKKTWSILRWKGEKPWHLLPRGQILRTRCSGKGGDTEGHTGCDSTNDKCPEQSDPQTQSGFLVVRGWGAQNGERLLMETGCLLGVEECFGMWTLQWIKWIVYSKTRYFDSPV